ncbi:protein atonal homolog 8 [Ischnura elegans]|uniref:protein atonal homolog 8 n=1 Tax=Ischnura elegans TaxID=197161 RepID=UPI001ED86F83|nr:protein atonal homolog 8 [Ischnura elegans]
MCSQPPASDDSASPPPMDHRRTRNSILIGPTMAQAILHRCSDEEDAVGRMDTEEEEGEQSRTSDDSVEVRVRPIGPKNKRKLAEPRKVSAKAAAICRPYCPTAYHPQAPFRPWSSTSPPPAGRSEALELRGQPQRPASTHGSPQLKREEDIPEEVRWDPSAASSARVPTAPPDDEDDECDVPMALEAASTSSARADDSRRHDSVVGDEHRSHLRNYKNMTRERRMEANARERTRVHTISAAFDTLRRAVPAYAHNQRLSKLSVLRIACAYIVTLSRVAGKDYSAANDAPSLGECVDAVTRTIQTEGKVRRRRDE